MDKRPDLSLIIAVYKKPEFLRLILESALNQKIKDFEIVIADDGSDESIGNLVQEYTGKFSYPIQHIWHEDDGFRKTIIANKAIIAAKSEYLVFIDGDCILHRNFFTAHCRYRRRNHVLSGRRVMLDETITKAITLDDVRSGRVEKLSFWWNNCKKKDRRRGFYLPYASVLENLFKKDYWAIGSNFSLYKEDLLAVNGYDESIVGRGMEDINLSQRFKLNGYRILNIAREALQYHLYHSSKPVPHSEGDLELLAHPRKAWAENGIVKSAATTEEKQ